LLTHNLVWAASWAELVPDPALNVSKQRLAGQELDIIRVAAGTLAGEKAGSDSSLAGSGWLSADQHDNGALPWLDIIPV